MQVEEQTMELWELQEQQLQEFKNMKHEVDRLRQVIIDTKQCLLYSPAVVDTIWFGDCCTLVEHLEWGLKR